MSHANQYWANKLPEHLRPQFWAEVDFGHNMSGETAYNYITKGRRC